MQKKMLYIHIGQPKTGTTSIQKFLALNRELLLNQHDLYYPISAQGGSRHKLEFLFADSKLDSSNPNSPDVKIASEQLEKLLVKLKQSPANRILLSSELLFYSGKKLKEIKEVFSDYDVKIIIYLRRIDHFVESWYKQKFRGAREKCWQADAKSFYQYYLQNYVESRSRLIEAVITHFGKQNILIRPFEKEQNQPHIFADFLSLFKIELDEHFAFLKRKNVSLSNEVIELVRKIQSINNRHLLGKTRMGKTLNYLLKKHPTQHKEQSLYSPQQRIELLKACEESDRQIAQEFLGQDKLFYEPWPDPNEDWQKPKYKHPKNLFLLYCKLFSKALFGQ